jgi:hypothetical protein
MTTMAMKTKKKKRVRKTQLWSRQNEMKVMMEMNINILKRATRKQPKLEIILRSQCIMIMSANMKKVRNVTMIRR